MAKIILPRRPVDLTNKDRQADMKRAIEFLSAMQNLKVTVNRRGQSATGSLQQSTKYGLININVPTVYESEVQTWVSGATDAGGTFTNNSVILANEAVVGLKEIGGFTRFKYLLPMVGGNLVTGIYPLIDTLGVGPPTNSGFGNSSFSENTGLQGDGVHILDSNIFPSQLGSNDNGGIGWYENNITGGISTNSTPTGYVHNPGGGTQEYSIFMSSSSYGFGWGKNGEISISGAPTNGSYYGQRASAVTRSFSVNGIPLAYSSVDDLATDTSFTGIRFMGLETSNVVPGPRYWRGRCGYAYLTDGTLTSEEIQAVARVLTNALVIRAGKPT